MSVCASTFFHKNTSKILCILIHFASFSIRTFHGAFKINFCNNFLLAKCYRFFFALSLSLIILFAQYPHFILPLSFDLALCWTLCILLLLLFFHGIVYTGRNMIRQVRWITSDTVFVCDVISKIGRLQHSKNIEKQVQLRRRLPNDNNIKLSLRIYPKCITMHISGSIYTTILHTPHTHTLSHSISSHSKYIRYIGVSNGRQNT